MDKSQSEISVDKQTQELDNEFKELLKQDFFRFDLEKIKELKLKFFKEAFRHHYNNCPEYKRYCVFNKTEPEDIQEYQDLEKIQPVPADAFRDSDNLILSVPQDEVKEIFTTSSTTSPNPVRYAYNAQDYELISEMNGPLWKDGYDIPNPVSMFFLAPSPKESDTGLVKGGYLGWKGVGFKDENIEFGVKNGKIDAEDIIEKIKNCEKPVTIYGPPFAYLPFMEIWKNKGKKPLVDLSGKARLITTGGWKGVKHDVSKEELKEQIAKAFNVNLSDIRDGYGSTDIMTMLPECAYGKKHVPFWNHVSIRDPEDTNKELEPGKEGLVVLMASWPRAYPAFCMTGDMGYIKEEECECGRKGQTVEITGRAKGAGARGCAIRLEQFMDAIKKENAFDF